MRGRSHSPLFNTSKEAAPQHSIWRSEAAELRELLVQRAGAYRPRVYEVVAGRVLHDAHVAVQVDLVRVKVRARVRVRVRVKVRARVRVRVRVRSSMGQPFHLTKYSRVTAATFFRLDLLPPRSDVATGRSSNT